MPSHEVSVPHPISFSAVVLGALLCAAILTAFAALGGGIGIFSLDLRQPHAPSASLTWMTAVFVGVGVIVAAFAGGFVASRLCDQARRSRALWHSLGSWSLVVVAFGFVAGAAITSIGSLLVQAGIGTAAGAGAASSVDEITRQLSEVRIVTDMHLLKGKAVTQIVVPRPGEELAGIAAKKLPSELKEAKKSIVSTGQGKREIRQAAGMVKTAAGGASLAFFVVILLGALAAGWGSSLAYRRDRFS